MGGMVNCVSALEVSPKMEEVEGSESIKVNRGQRFGWATDAS